ncbi:lytic polysaccharide monooxygenase [Streptacidiphilus sp. ASG 303]|uniref:lytic polysaccharide monooxygenase n=1 Tax=Streptacidiphilus sp. ASG 303 TaxID=2896847 RepID=UPI001E620721|nr:lytic polysaccharide monooxygenase [Streptacidiphilus sp. ASG 303]MCD0484376.1 lytic polysaccharide monooxygenase [Streptacidiphilus sp. ASG 303]
MAVRRRTTGALAGVAAVLLGWAAAGPAAAHGAMADPPSRTVECGPEGAAAAASPACAAAVAASDPGAVRRWDDLRVAGVAGRDRQLIPDGRLCSGGIPAYHGLDLARADWPAAPLTSGATFTFRYRTTIPHQGVFRLYLTRDGWDPARPLRWSDLDAQPFLQAADPPVRDGAYVMTGRVPQDRTGRHLVYTVWQTTSTPDTYYSCSDVVLRASRAAAPAARTHATPGSRASTASTAVPAGPASPAVPASPAAPAPPPSAGRTSAPAAAGSPAPSGAGGPSADPQAAPAAATAPTSGGAPLAVGGAAAVLLAAVAAVLGARRRRGRSGRRPRRHAA